MHIVKELDAQEKLIVRELIRDVRISDNQIAKNAKIPVMTVNRKRKGLEEGGFLKYFTSLDTGEFGTGKYKAKQMYCIKFKIGITREEFIEAFEKDTGTLAFSPFYISLSYLGEKDGHLSYMCILDAETESKLLDEFNGKIIPHLKEKLGEDCIQEIITMRITNTLRRHHNYIPILNMSRGIIKKDWPDNYIFVDEDKTEMGKKDRLESSV